ncbi:hypothetical protein WG954_05810 [Lacibacter sp. H375]|uniref:hypothetical protein n=1 Tax=Lacibacter sp. H375 TaxID=3133424 RepID=UPI0030BFA324
MLQPIKITEEELSKNFQHWVDQFNPRTEPSTELTQNVSRLFTTHTFGYTKTVEGEIFYPYKNIFGIDIPAQGLLSDMYREINGLFEEKEKRRTMTAARAVGLNNYVFAYLSIHDPYYGRPGIEDTDMNHRPFGIFINKEIDIYPNCLPSRRDVNIYNISETVKIRKEFTHPKKVKDLATYQVVNDNDHKGDFWHYYGSPEHCQNEIYTIEAWKKRIEYHYFEKVDPENIAAVLWPIWIKHVRKPGVMDWDESYYFIQQISLNFPNLKIITYQWDEADPEMCFIEASYFTAKYLMKYDTFPETVEIAKTESYE